MITLITLIGTSYLLVMLYFAWGFRKINSEKITGNVSAKTPFTVIIPFRNETQHLPTLVQSLQSQHEFAADEIIFVNDNSQDKSEELLNSLLSEFPMKYRVLETQGEGKKAALLTGIQAAQTEWIVTTDADVIVPETWLEELSIQISSTKAHLLVMPITLLSDGSIFQDLQKLESAALVGMSAGALMNGKALSANGANFAFTKSIFEKVGGYLPETNTPSGDDEFLLKRVHAMDVSLVQVCFSKGLLVQTATCKNFKQLISQRTRWASKVKFQKINLQHLLVLLPSLFMGLLILVLFFSIFSSYRSFFTSLLLNKWIADFILFFVIKQFFGFSYIWLRSLVLLPFYQIIYMLPVLYNKIFAKFQWKGREYGA